MMSTHFSDIVSIVWGQGHGSLHQGERLLQHQSVSTGLEEEERGGGGGEGERGGREGGRERR